MRSATTAPGGGPTRRGEIFFSAITGLPVPMDGAPASERSGGLLRWAASSTAPPSTLLVRAVVGAVFLLEGSLKFLDPDGLGAGRFAKIGIPFPSFTAPFDGVFEIACGIGLVLGLLTRWAAIPMIVNMLVAISTTKIPILVVDGFWKAAHEMRLDVSMLFACLFLLLAGGGPVSLDALLLPPRPRPDAALAADDDGW